MWDIQVMHGAALNDKINNEKARAAIDALLPGESILVDIVVAGEYHSTIEVTVPLTVEDKDASS